MNSPAPEVRENLNRTLRRLDEIRPAQLSVEKLRRLRGGIQIRFEELETEAVQLEASLQESLDRSQYDVLQNAKTKTARLRAEADQLQDQDDKLDVAIQRQIVREGMASILGSDRAVSILESVVMILIVVVLSLLVYDSTAGEDATRPAWLSGDSIFLIDTVCCVIFMSEFFLRLYCAESKTFVWRHHWIDFFTSIPIPGQAQLARFGRVARLARFVRVLRMLRFLRFLRLFFLLWRGMDKLQDVIDVKLMKRTLRWAVAVTLLGALVIYLVEGNGWNSLYQGTGSATTSVGDPGDTSTSGPSRGSTENQVATSDETDAPIPQDNEEPNAVRSLPLALWWSFTTVVTGGFGDIHNPESGGGQVLTAVLVVMGMVLVGVFTATLTSLYVGEQAEEIERLQEDLGGRLDEIGKRLDRLEPSDG